MNSLTTLLLLSYISAAANSLSPGVPLCKGVQGVQSPVTDDK